MNITYNNIQENIVPNISLSYVNRNYFTSSNIYLTHILILVIFIEMSLYIFYEIRILLSHFIAGIMLNEIVIRHNGVYRVDIVFRKVNINECSLSKKRLCIIMFLLVYIVLLLCYFEVILKLYKFTSLSFQSSMNKLMNNYQISNNQ